MKRPDQQTSTSDRYMNTMDLDRAVRETLLQSVRDRSHVAQRKALILLMLSRGVQTVDIARILGVSGNTVRRWRRTWPEQGLNIFRHSAATGTSTPRTPPLIEMMRAQGIEPCADERFGIDGKDTMHEALLKILLTQLDRVVIEEPLAREGIDIEGVHRMRVAVRRIRCALMVFRKHIDAGQRDTLRRVLKDTGKALGCVRDLDIALDHLLTYAASLGSDAVIELMPYRCFLESRLMEGRRKLNERLDDSEYRDIVQRAVTALHAPAPEADKSTKHRKRERVAYSAPSVLYKRWAALMNNDFFVPQLDVATLHLIRIAFKNFRYVMEFFSEIMGKGSRGLILEMRDVQETLGRINDCRTILRVMDEFETLCGLPPNDAYAGYLTQVKATLEAGLTGFPEVWKHFTKRKIRKVLAKAIGKI